MTDDQIKNRIKEFFKNNMLTVIATVDSDTHKPESAVIGFAEKDDLSIVFVTSNASRKYKNLQNNQNVSFVIGWSPEKGTVQYEGTVRELSGSEETEHRDIMLLKNPHTGKFIAKEDQRYFLVTPTWIRLLDTTKEFGGKYEISL